MCEYCDNIPSNYEGFYVVFKQTSATNVEKVKIEANYCPNCGRKLNKVSNDRELVNGNVMIELTKPYEHIFRCSCGCNIFSKYVDSECKEIYVCHGCRSEYT